MCTLRHPPTANQQATGKRSRLGMGNTASNKAPDSASGAYSPTPREETVYGDYFHPPPSSRYSSSGTYAPSSLGTTSSSVTPPVPPRTSGLERRSMTVVARERPSESPVRIILELLALLNTACVQFLICAAVLNTMTPLDPCIEVASSPGPLRGRS